MTSPALAPSALAHLREVYDRYMAADFGQKNTTAAELEKTCRDLGWFRNNADAPGCKVWTERQLGIKP